MFLLKPTNQTYTFEVKMVSEECHIYVIYLLRHPHKHTPKTTHTHTYNTHIVRRGKKKHFSKTFDFKENYICLKAGYGMG